MAGNALLIDKRIHILANFFFRIRDHCDFIDEDGKYYSLICKALQKILTFIIYEDLYSRIDTDLEGIKSISHNLQ